MFWLELLVVVAALLIGTRIGGFGLGVIGGIGLTILVFVFGVQPTSPPIDVILMITAVVTAASVLEAAGGLDYLVALAAYVLRKNPKHVTYLAPFITWLAAVFAGSAHVSYSLLPVIAEVARKTGIRPERPLSVSVVAASMAMTSSPISPATMALFSLVGPLGVQFFDIMKINIPAHVIGLLVIAAVASRMGKDLSKDEAYQERVRQGLSAPVDAADNLDSTDFSHIPTTAKASVAIFLAGTTLVVLLGSFAELRPSWVVNEKTIRMNMPNTIQMLMLSIAGIIMLVAKVKPKQVVSGMVFPAGIQAVIAIFGIAWMVDSFFSFNLPMLRGGIGDMVKNAPWTFAIALAALGGVLYSQGATVRALVPLGISLGISPIYLVAMLPAANNLFIIPNYPTALAAIGFDRTGSTGIGKYLLNHSFIVPGLLALVVNTVAAFFLMYVFFG